MTFIFLASFHMNFVRIERFGNIYCSEFKTFEERKTKTKCHKKFIRSFIAQKNRMENYNLQFSYVGKLMK